MTVELRHLLAIGEYGTFGRAAAALGMTQPALSRSVQGLEEEVGTRLFERSKRGVTLTDEGRLLIRRAREVVQSADELVREVGSRRVPGAGQVTLGTGPFPGEVIVPPAVSRFVAAYPLVRVRVLVRDWDELLHRLRMRELDLFVAEISTLEGERDLDIEPLSAHSLHLVARRGHPLMRRAAVRTEHIFAYPVVALSRIPPRVLQPLLDTRDKGGTRPGRPFPALEMSNLSAVKRVLEGSDAISALHLPCMAEELASGALVLLGTEPWMSLRYGLVRLKGQTPSQATTALCELIREAEAALVREENQLAARHSSQPKKPAKTRQPRG